MKNASCNSPRELGGTSVLNPWVIEPEKSITSQFNVENKSKELGNKATQTARQLRHEPFGRCVIPRPNGFILNGTA